MIATLPSRICPRCGAECWLHVSCWVDGKPRYQWSCTVCGDERDELEMPEVEP